MSGSLQGAERNSVVATAATMALVVLLWGLGGCTAFGALLKKKNTKLRITN